MVTTAAMHISVFRHLFMLWKENMKMEGDRFARIAEVTDGYTVPEDGCTTYRVAYSMLKDFEMDLHKHIHLENNILFPKAIEMEFEVK
jgi:regulator of cell morphogenesis and NO signaling